ncbi:MAG: hypothetical protein KKC84_03435 [Candidatus Omnitrophica bacterium]|nr:hypothetical protein [Candidatus Omnitrophota bacterium]
MKKFWGVVVFMSFFLGGTVGAVCAQEEAGTEQATDWKQEFSADREALQAQKQEIQQNAQTARQGESDLLKQIREAERSGDLETARTLGSELTALHEANTQQKQQDLEALKGARQEMRQDYQAAREEGIVPPRQADKPPLPKKPPLDENGLPVKRGEGRPPYYKPPLPEGESVGEGEYKPYPSPRRAADRREDVWDKKEDIRDRREDIMDRKEDVWDRKHEGGRRDKLEDIRDRREDIRDRREDVRDRQEDFRDRGPALDRRTADGQGSKLGNPPGRAGGPGAGKKVGNPPGRAGGPGAGRAGSAPRGGAGGGPRRQ